MKAIILFEIYINNIRMGYSHGNISIEDLEKLREYIADVISNRKGMIPKGEKQ